ncbi:unnamed protein product [Effrenium voratum]|uniref:Steroid 5-alpha reductase C-terminal domain-containing protein n=1 Tax=Effrenium voratum TaxID=2562239 RepID=A0AA36IAN1_9DINO|nr:unnamed protein product [Effrenium voratum]
MARKALGVCLILLPWLALRLGKMTEAWRACWDQLHCMPECCLKCSASRDGAQVAASAACDIMILNRGIRSFTMRAAGYTAAAAAFSPAPLATSALVFGAANGIGFVVSLATGWHYHLDLLGTGAFSAFAFALRGTHWRQQVSAACIGIWGAKLAAFLFYRALQTHHDARLEEVLAGLSGTFGFWFISFLWGWVVSLPHALAAGVPLGARPAFSWLDVVGLGIFALGLMLETLADWQKWRFKQDPDSRGKFCDVGVWQLSRRPNWFGNLLLWSGIVVLNSTTLAAAGPLPAAASLVSPLFLLALFLGQASGAITKTVEMEKEKYGSDPAYQEYLQQTPMLFPSGHSVLRTLGFIE